MSSKKINRMGFLDIEMRDDTNTPIFRLKNQNLGQGIRNFEKFLEEKYGIKGFSAWEKSKK